MPRAEHSASSRKLTLKLVQKSQTTQNSPVLTLRSDQNRRAAHSKLQLCIFLLSLEQNSGIRDTVWTVTCEFNLDKEADYPRAAVSQFSQ
jgi:hypothetical protein